MEGFWFIAKMDMVEKALQTFSMSEPNYLSINIKQLKILSTIIGAISKKERWSRTAAEICNTVFKHLKESNTKLRLKLQHLT